MSRQGSNWELKGGNYLKFFFFLLIGKNIQFIILYFLTWYFGEEQKEIFLYYCSNCINKFVLNPIFS
jgi:hypothetical protein